MAATIRAFVAIELPDRLKDGLAELQQGLKAASAGTSGTPGRLSWTRPGAMHLTLKFLGEVEEARVDEMAVALEKAAEGVGAFELATGPVGAFPDMKRPRVVWIGLDGSNGLTLLAGNVEDEFRLIGFEREAKRFTPHLTLCRARDAGGSKALAAALVGLKTEAPRPGFTVTAVTLFKSELKAGGAVHTPLRQIGLEA